MSAAADPARCFVAVAPDAAARAALAAVLRALSGLRADVRWVAAENAHLTLKFLGDVPRARLAELGAALDPLAGAPAPRLGVEGFGWFPPRGRPRVLWAGLSGDLQLLLDLAARVEDRLGPLGFPPEARPFRPHLTLGRVRGPRGLDAVHEAVAAAPLHSAPGPVEELVLFESVRGAGGARYAARHRVPLGASAGGG